MEAFLPRFITIHLNELAKARYYTQPGRPNTKGEVSVAHSVVRDSSRQERVQIYHDYDKAEGWSTSGCESDSGELL